MMLDWLKVFLISFILIFMFSVLGEGFKRWLFCNFCGWEWGTSEGSDEDIRLFFLIFFYLVLVWLTNFFFNMLLFFFETTIFAFLIFSLFIKFCDEKYSKYIAFVFSLYTFFLSIFLIIFFDFSKIFLNVYEFSFSKNFTLNFIIALDVFSLFFIVLTTFLFSLIVLSSWKSIKYKLKLFYFILMVIELFLIFAFISFDLFFFYFWFESILIPMSVLIGIWGNQSRKINAVFYFFIYTVLGSSLMLFSIMYIHVFFKTTNFFMLSYFLVFNKQQQIFLWIAFFLAFAVKIPMVPFHIWLPEAHVEAPTAGSMILAGLLLKLGYYGFVRFFLTMFPEANLFFNPLISSLCILGCLYGALLALSQIDIKKIIAYSSVSHMNLCVLGIFSFDLNSLVGSCLLAVGHGFVSVALFFLVGCLYERCHTRLLDYYSGVSYLMPVFSLFFFYFTISNFAFPVSINFVAEFLIFLGIANWNLFNFFFLIFYSVLSVSYNLWLYTKVALGTFKSTNKYLIDLSKLELCVLIPLAFLNFFLCFFPTFLLQMLVPFFFFLI